MGRQLRQWIFVDKENLSVKLESMPSRTRERLHFHSKAQQFFYILKGKATFYLMGKTELINENQGILVDTQMEHYIANETEKPLDFLVISQPPTNNDRTTLEK